MVTIRADGGYLDVPRRSIEGRRVRVIVGDAPILDLPNIHELAAATFAAQHVQIEGNLDAIQYLERHLPNAWREARVAYELTMANLDDVPRF
ncbi:hypothetical protein [Labedaea rhizosphaerae]|uniref:hypothetical protein n=1 Tax=Labedaea rhizosphaerae TaxID=598644 RepID=UPI00105B55DC|nr:hypothetical protein [Labedaea rhizosphaerae]